MIATNASVESPIPEMGYGNNFSSRSEGEVEEVHHSARDGDI